MFNDILVKTSAQGGLFHKNCTYTYKKTIQFDSVTLEDLPSKKGGSSTMFCLVPDEVYKETDPVQQKKKRKKMQYQFGCLSEEEKVSWMRDMGDAINVRKLMKELGASAVMASIDNHHHSSSSSSTPSSSSPSPQTAGTQVTLIRRSDHNNELG